MARFLDWLIRSNPRTGRVVTERGTYVNMADLIERLEFAVDPFSQIQTAEYTPIVERKPLPGLSFIRDRVAGEGTVDIFQGEYRINGTAGTTALYTRDFGRYLPGIIGVPGIGLRFEDKSTGHYEYGYGNGSGNRVGLEWQDGEAFTFIESRGERYYRKPRSEWLDPLDGTGPSSLNLDLDSHILRIPFGWYGYLSFVWVIAVATGDGTDRLVVIDRSGPPPAGRVSLEQPDLPIFAEADGGILYVGGRQYGVYGRYRPQFRVASSPNIRRTDISDTFTPVVSFRVKEETRWRGVPVQLSGVDILATENCEWRIIVGADLTGANWGDIDGIPAEETSLEIDTSATAFTGGYKAFADNVSGGQGNTSGQESQQLPDLNLPRELSVTLAVRRITSGTATIDAVLRAREEW